MGSLLLSATSYIPQGYTTPPFPSLYYPFPIRSTHGYFLYHTGDIVRFTLYWTLLFYAAIHLAAGGYAVAMQLHNWKIIWIAPVMFCLIGGLEAVMAGSVVGALLVKPYQTSLAIFVTVLTHGMYSLGATYEAGPFRMSTWIPFAWALINSLVVILSSFAISGGL